MKRDTVGPKARNGLQGTLANARRRRRWWSTTRELRVQRSGMSNDGLARLRDEMEVIIVLGPIAHVDQSTEYVSIAHEIVEFCSDATDNVCKYSGNDDEPFIEPFAWRMVDNGYAPCAFGIRAFPDSWRLRLSCRARSL